MNSAPIVRFAPSPTGRIHIGNARTALLNWLYARRHGGTFILRFDDTDFERSKTEYAEAIEEDLAWLGVKPDLVRRQSARMAAYDAAAEKLKAQGRLYPAYETAEELERRRKRQQALGRPPIYDRAALRLSDAERAALEALLPGPATLLLPNRANRFPLACPLEGGANSLGLRVPAWTAALAALDTVGVAVLQSSANLSGEPDARRLLDVPASIRAGADLLLDGGELPGVPSTVLDLSEYERRGEWSVVREGPLARSDIELILASC